MSNVAKSSGRDESATTDLPLVATLVEVLRARAASDADGWAYVFLADGEREEDRLTWGELDRHARAVAAALQERGARGKPVLLLFPPGLEFVAAFFGCLYAGAVAVPSYPPSGRSAPRLRSILQDARPCLALATRAIIERWPALARDLGGGAAEIALIAPAELPDSAAEAWRPYAPEPGDLAFLQYTSGSTSDPKGVMVTHGNLVHNEVLIRDACRHDEGSTFVSWLPMYHDMGLIGCVLQPLFVGAPCVLMSPLAFLQKPERWLRAVDHYRAHTSGAPNFAYDLCVRRIPPERRKGLDLSSWRVAFNGAEPVHAATLESFADAFADCGFRREAFFPCYGLAEATLIVSGRTRPEPPTVGRFRGLDEGLAVADDGGGALVASGEILSGQRIAVVDSATGERADGGRVGEIWLAGPSVARGYWGRPEQTARDFGARLPGDGTPFLRTGDLGFLHEGRLFVTGRLKDLIIVRGRNHYPQDVERTAESSHPAVRPGAGAAFAIDLPGGEGMALVQEVDPRQTGERSGEILDALRRAVVSEHGAALAAVALVRPGTMPKTTSGKIQRQLCRRLYLEGALDPLAEWRSSDDEEQALADLAGASIAASGEVSSWLIRRVAHHLGVEHSAIDPELSLAELGLDSIQAIELVQAAAAELAAELPLDVFLGAPSLASLAESIETLLADPPATETLAAERDFALDPGARGLWLLQRVEPGSPAYNIAGAARIPGPVDDGALRRALAALAMRHPALRSSFPAPDGEPLQRIAAAGEVDFEHAVTGLAGEDLQRRMVEEACRPFDFERGPLVRVRRLDASGGERFLLLVVHHIVADLWSMAVLLDDLGALYAAETGAAAPPLPAPAAALSPPPAKRVQELAQRWRQRLEGYPALLELPADRTRALSPRHRAAGCRLELDAGTAEGLRALARGTGATLFVALLAGYLAWLHRVTGRERLVAGTPSAGRGRPELARRVGYFVQPAAIPSDVSGDPGFAALLERTRGAVLESLRDALPLPLVMEAVQPERDPARHPLFQAVLALHKAPLPAWSGLAAFALGQPGARLDVGGFILESVPLPEVPAPFDLALLAAEVDGRLAASLHVDLDLFDRVTGERMARQIASLFAAAAGDPGRRLSDLPLLGKGERWQVLAEWNDTAGTGRDPRLIMQRVRDVARSAPEAVAVAQEERSLTYGELVRRAAGLAGHLRRLGVAPEDRVAVVSERCPEMIAGLLAVLEAGGAYVPIDPASPAERVAWLLRDSGARVVLAHPALPAALPAEVPVLLLEEGVPAGPELPDARIDPARLAYVVYTSGSTGQPKGVQVSHRSLANLVDWHLETFGVTAADVASHLAGVAFDASVWEIWTCLSAGARLELPPDRARASPLALRSWLAERGVTTAFVPTPMAHELLALEGFGGEGALRLLLTGGDELRASPRPGCRFRLWNNYGPTEGTVVATSGLVKPDGAGAPDLGRPISDVRVHLLDAHLRPMPPGVPGEVGLTGAGLARGYLGRPDLTAERFVPDALGEEPGGRLYRTGDLARWRPDGTLAFLGRLDAQVQVRGFRVEPAEIEAALRLHPCVTDALVIAAAGAGGERSLVAFVVSGSAAPTELRELLGRWLPAYMIPSRLVRLGAFPLTANGKIDRRALVELAQSAPEASSGAGPGNAVEELVAGILAEALGRDAVGVHDDFFELGGHSLLAASVAARLREALGLEIPLRLILESPTVAGIAAAAELELRAGRRPAEPPRRRPDGGDAPLTSGQERLWFLDRLQPGAAYNVPLEARLEGALSLPALAAALAELERRHEALRSTFPQVDRGPVQRVASAARQILPVVDLSCLAEPRRGGEADRLAREEAGRFFDLAAGPVARRRLLRLADGSHRLLWTLHHIVCDGRSLEVLLQELAALYAAALAGGPSPLPEPLLQLADVALWERQRLAGPGLDEPLLYWERKLLQAPPLELPMDRPRPAARSWRGGTRSLRLPASAAASAAALARCERTTPFLLLLAVWAAQLHRCCEQRDITVGTPAAGRGHSGLDRVVGFLVNTIALRVEVERDLPLRALLARVRRCGVEAFGQADLPFEKVVERLHPERALSLHPVFQVTFALRPAPAPAVLPGLELVPRAVDSGTAKLDLGLSVDWSEDGLAAALEYAADLFDAATGDRLLAGFATLLAGALEDPGRTVGDLPLLPEGERRQVLAAWGDRSSPPPPLVHAEVAAWAGRCPGALAVEEEGTRLTYGDLDLRAGAVARRLREMGVGPESIVAVLARRCCHLLAAALGVLKAGGAYAPLDPSSPPERLAAMLESAGSPVILAEGELLHCLPAGYAAPVLEIGEAVSAGGALPGPPAVEPENLAYLIFTSGSTGVPKAVALTHGGLAHMAAWVRQSFALGPQDRATQVAAPAFDASVFEIWPILTAGASLHRPPEEERLAPAGLLAWASDRRLTVAFLPTPLAELALAEPWPEGAALRILSTGGDRLRRRPEERHPFALFNVYGPSEVTVLTTVGEVRPDAPGRTPSMPTIGRSPSYIRTAVLDAGLEPVSLGIPGELCAGGVALARGYLGRPDLTAERFVPDPHSFRPGERLYLTGDRVRLLPDGELEFLGRRDQQVKLRGLRFEIGEVEAALAALPEVREVVAALRAGPRGEPHLVAWVAGHGTAPDAAALRAALRNRLPAYMIPSTLVAVPALPLTANGKIDRRALPEPDWSRPELSGEYVAPRTAVETLLAGIWAELLEVERVGVHDSFFELGGHSLKATRLVARLRETFGVDLPLQSVFEAPTVAAMSVAIAVHLVSRSDPRALANLRTDVEQRAYP